MGGFEFLNSFVDIIVPPGLVSFLNRVLYDSKFLIINNWSFVHFFSGVAFYFLFPKRLRLWILINVVFEIVEYSLGIGRHPLFFEETKDIIWDLIITIGAFVLTRWIFEQWRKRG